jgi:tol-pal system protein YbgF
VNTITLTHLGTRLARAGMLALVCGLPLQAHALFGDDEARAAILDLRKRFDAANASQSQLIQDNAQLRRSVLDLQAQIETLRGELATMKGVEEQLTRDVSELQRKQRDLSQSVDDRLSKAAAAPTAGASAPQEPTAAAPEANPQKDFDAAMAVFRGGNFTGAQKAFAGFLKTHPKSAQYPAALFWLGNAQYATKNYKEAVNNFRGSLSMEPSGPRAAEAMLAIANCQIELKDTAAARKTLDDLVKRFPKSEAAQAAKDRLARLK